MDTPAPAVVQSLTAPPSSSSQGVPREGHEGDKAEFVFATPAQERAFETFKREVERFNRLENKVKTINNVLGIDESDTEMWTTAQKVRRCKQLMLILHPDKTSGFPMTKDLEEDSKAALATVSRFKEALERLDPATYRNLRPTPWSQPSQWQPEQPRARAEGAPDGGMIYDPNHSLRVRPTDAPPECYEADENGEFMCILCRTSTKCAYVTQGHLFSKKHQRRVPEWRYWLEQNRR